MSDVLPSIDLDLRRKLEDREYRRRFFLVEASALIAKQLIDLRKRRALTQSELAALAQTGQPAISRAERADYQNWSFNTLRSLAEAMDARIRVVIEPAEDVLGEYETPSEAQTVSKSAATDTKELGQQQYEPKQAASAEFGKPPRLSKISSESHGISNDREH